MPYVSIELMIEKVGANLLVKTQSAKMVTGLREIAPNE
jgi:hypothetical protein